LGKHKKTMEKSSTKIGTKSNKTCGHKKKFKDQLITPNVHSKKFNDNLNGKRASNRKKKKNYQHP
jgi:hypothetical protein